MIAPLRRSFATIPPGIRKAKIIVQKLKATTNRPKRAIMPAPRAMASICSGDGSPAPPSISCPTACMRSRVSARS